MSTRTNGQPLWLIRPIIDNCIREDLAQFAVGTLAAAVACANTLHIETGHQHSVRRVEDE